MYQESEYEIDSEDEMPLAKLRKVKMASSSPYTPSSSTRGNEVRRLDCVMQSPSSGHRPDGPRWRRL